MINLIDKQQRYFSRTITLLLLLSMNHIYADSKSNQVNYSPDHWPSRWSSAISQQQNGKFPNREQNQIQPAELPEAVSEQDLFYSSWSKATQMGTGDKITKSDRRYLQQPVRNSQRQVAYHYQPSRTNYNRLKALPYGYHGPTYGVNPYYGSTPLFDPVLGHTGGGLPFMPGNSPYGSPYGLAPYGVAPYGGINPYMGSQNSGFPFGFMPFSMTPFGGAPYGHYGSPGMWNPFFGNW